MNNSMLCNLHVFLVSKINELVTKTSLYISYLFKISSSGTFLAIQWLRIQLAMQGTWGQIPGQGIKTPDAEGNSACTLQLEEPSWGRNQGKPVPCKEPQHSPASLTKKYSCKVEIQDFPGCTVDRSPPANAGDTTQIPGPEGVNMPQAT